MRVLSVVAQAALLVAFVLSAVAVNIDWVSTPVGDGSLWEAPVGGTWYSFEVEQLGGTPMVKAAVFVVLAGAVLTLVAALLGFAGNLWMGITATLAALTSLTGAVLYPAAVERHLSGLDADPLDGLLLTWVSAGMALLSGFAAIQAAVMNRRAAQPSAEATEGAGTA